MPEKRLDKNGKLVTRHVSTGTAKSVAAPLPVPTGQPIDKLSPEQLVEEDWLFTSSDFNPSVEMESAWKKRSATYGFTASDKTFYAMLKAVNIDDAIVLLSHSVDTPMKALNFLKKKKLEHHVVDGDYSRIFSRAIYRGIPAEDLITMHRKILFNGVELEDKYQSVIDAAEAYGMKRLRKRSIWMQVAEGKLRIEDLKAVGEDRIEDYDDPDQILTFMETLRQVGHEVTSEELASLVDRLHNEKDCSWMSVDGLLNRFTPAQISHLYSLKGSASMAHYSNGRESTEERYARTVHYDAIVHLSEQPESDFNWKTMDFAAAVATFKAGLSPEDSMDCISKEMTPNQYIAIKNHGIASSVSGGWL